MLPLGLDAPEHSSIQPHMTRQEAECLHRHLVMTNTLVEFGCGGSTSMAVRSGVKRVFSVESDLKWVEKLRTEPTIRKAVQANRLEFVVPDIGAVGAWGRPIDFEKRANWHHYHSAVWRKVDPAEVDLVLVDGRFRVACALQAILRVRSDCRILFHDFWNRSKYHVILNYLTTIERVDSLGAFKVKEPRQTDKLLNLLFASISNPK